MEASTRFSDTGTRVRSDWANRLTRSSSINQPISSTNPGNGPGGRRFAELGVRVLAAQDRWL